MNSNDISHELKAIADNFEAENYGVVVQQTLVLIEKKLREVIKHDLTQLESSAQVAVMKHLVAKSKAIDDLTMGEIVGLLRETKFFEAWKQKFHRDLRVFETVDLNKLTNPLRNDVAHGKQSGHTREEAELLMSYHRIVCQTFGEPDRLKSRRAIGLKLWSKGLKKPVVISLVVFLPFLLWGAFELANKFPLEFTPKEVAQLIERAKRGDVNAQIELGEAYYKGDKVDKNYQEAKKQLEPAVAQGEPRALNLLAIMYALGRGVEQNYSTAKKLFEKAGDNAASLNLLHMYVEGLIPKDEQHIAKLIDKIKWQLLSGRFISSVSVQHMFNDDGYKGLITYVEQQVKSPATSEVVPNTVTQPEIVIQPTVPIVTDASPAIAPTTPEPQPTASEMVTQLPPVAQIPAEAPKTIPTNQPAFTGCEAVTTIPKEECETLVNFYHSTDGDNWERNTGWLKVNDPCQWFSVGCENGKVIILGKSTIVGDSISRINNNRLKGSIPDLSQLKELREIYLDDNQLTGTIPDLSQLKELREIYLDDNQLTGTIPDLSQLKKLEWLRLGKNQLTGTIPDLSQLKKLEWLSLGKNQLTGTIPDLSQLKKLEAFWFNDNRLTGSIPDLSQLKGLDFFNISGNNLCRDTNIRYPEKWQAEVNKYPLCTTKYK